MQLLVALNGLELRPYSPIRNRAIGLNRNKAQFIQADKFTCECPVRLVAIQGPVQLFEIGAGCLFCRLIGEGIDRFTDIQDAMKQICFAVVKKPPSLPDALLATTTYEVAVLQAVRPVPDVGIDPLKLLSKASDSE